MATTTTDRVRTALSTADFPADKDELVRNAQELQADAETVKALRAMPPERYGNIDEVLRSVPLEVDQNLADTAPQRQTSAKSGLAESEKEVSDHPIVEELGENRGS